MKKLIILLVVLIPVYQKTNAQVIEVTQEKMIYKEINGQNLAVHIFYAPGVMKKSMQVAYTGPITMIVCTLEMVSKDRHRLEVLKNTPLLME